MILSIFDIKPDYNLLMKYGYVQSATMEVNQAAQLGYESMSCYANYYNGVPNRDNWFNELCEVIDKYKIVQNKDTLIYIILDEHENAYEKLWAAKERAESILAIKELAKVVNLYENEAGKKNTVHVRFSYGDPERGVRITDKDKVKHLRSLVFQWFKDEVSSLSAFRPDILQLQDDSQKQHRTEDWVFSELARKITESQTSLYPSLTRSTLALFLLNVAIFIKEQTELTSPKFTNNQLRLLHEIAVILGWKMKIRSKNPKSVANAVRTLIDNLLLSNGVKRGYESISIKHFL